MSTKIDFYFDKGPSPCSSSSRSVIRKLSVYYRISKKFIHQHRVQDKPPGAAFKSVSQLLLATPRARKRTKKSFVLGLLRQVYKSNYQGRQEAIDKLEEINSPNTVPLVWGGRGEEVSLWPVIGGGPVHLSLTWL